jgi:ABC-type polysaccharide transport system permease subunit
MESISMSQKAASFVESPPSKKKRWGADKVYTNLSYLIMVLPGVIWLFLFAYLPMPGIVLAFKTYRLSRPPQDHWIQNNFLYSLI